MDTDKNKAWEFLSNNNLAVLATISSEENAPQASLVYYINDENFHIYIVTTKDSRKITNISKSNKVALVVGLEMDPMVLQLEGTAKILEDEDKKHDLSNRYLEITNSNTKTLNSHHWPPLMKLPVSGEFAFVEITINHFKFSDFTEANSFIIEGTPRDWHTK